MFEYYYSGSSSTPHDYHYHDFFEMFILLSGDNKSFFIEDKTYTVKASDIIFIRHDLLHKSNFVPSEYNRVIIHFSNEHVGNDIIGEIAGLFDGRVYTPPSPDIVRRKLISIADEMGKNDPFAKHLVKLHFTDLLAYCVRNKSVYSHETALSNPAIERLVRYINSNFHSRLTLKQAAAMLKMSDGHLSRLFAASTGFSFSEYIAVVRIKNAKQLLKNTKKTIHQIAGECGFNDSNYFSTVFKSAAGLSPLAYRRNAVDNLPLQYYP